MRPRIPHAMTVIPVAFSLLRSPASVQIVGIQTDRNNAATVASTPFR